MVISKQKLEHTYGSQVEFKFKYRKGNATGTIIELFGQNPHLVHVYVVKTDSQHIVDTHTNKEI